MEKGLIKTFKHKELVIIIPKDPTTVWRDFRKQQHKHRNIKFLIDIVPCGKDHLLFEDTISSLRLIRSGYDFIKPKIRKRFFIDGRAKIDCRVKFWNKNHKVSSVKKSFMIDVWYVREEFLALLKHRNIEAWLAKDEEGKLPSLIQSHGAIYSIYEFIDKFTFEINLLFKKTFSCWQEAEDYDRHLENWARRLLAENVSETKSRQA